MVNIRFIITLLLNINVFRSVEHHVPIRDHISFRILSKILALLLLSPAVIKKLLTLTYTNWNLYHL